MCERRTYTDATHINETEPSNDERTDVVDRNADDHANAIAREGGVAGDGDLG